MDNRDERMRLWTTRLVPLLGSRVPAQMRAGIDHLYDDWMYEAIADDYYGHSDFLNLGYWDPQTASQREASENLVEKLLSFIPEKRGTILDVACGKGATTRYLLKYYASSAVTGINISAKQLETCRHNAPGCTFLQMDSTELAFPDQSFDNIICVEAAFHFNTRERFLSEAWRILKPGGRLVLSDILLRSRVLEALNPYRMAKNHVRSLHGYEALYLRAGFEDVHVIDSTRQSWVEFRNHYLRFLHERANSAPVDRKKMDKTERFLYYGHFAIRYYLLASARKPGGAA